MDRNENGDLVLTWRSLALIVYLTICCVDFIIAPFYHQYTTAQHYSPAKLIAMVQHLPEDQRGAALTAMKSDRVWEPLTNSGGGMFHVAFGGLLTAAAWQSGGRGSVRTKRKNLRDAQREMNGDAEQLAVEPIDPVEGEELR